jgi:hypothetical protein
MKHPYRTLKRVRLPSGEVKPGQRLLLDEITARMLLQRGDIERITPFPTVGAQLSALPAVPALPPQTSPESASGAPRRRGRPRKQSLS